MNSQRSNAKSVLIIEDDSSLQISIRKGLVEQGYSVEVASDISTAYDKLKGSAFELVLLDLGLPDGNGLSFLTYFREHYSDAPVLIMTARGDVHDKIKALDLGADDYLVKPFDFQELSARVRAHLRRSGPQPKSTLDIGTLHIDFITRTVKRTERVIQCTPREFDVLAYLAQRPGQPVSRHVLMTEVWKLQSRMTSIDNVIDVLISRLRDKVDGKEDSKLIHTVRGLGFMIKDKE